MKTTQNVLKMSAVSLAWTEGRRRHWLTAATTIEWYQLSPFD